MLSGFHRYYNFISNVFFFFGVSVYTLFWFDEKVSKPLVGVEISMDIETENERRI